MLKRTFTAPEDRLFTPQFLLMCLYSFTVFLSAFQLFPTAPFRIIDLGGSTFTAGLFLGFLTYASALSAPLTGALADRWGRRRMLMISSSALAVFSVGYALSPNYYLPLVIVVFHGIFWSGLLSASSAYITDIIPAHRRAEGISYWGMASILSVATAPSIGLWIYSFGWVWVCVSIGAMNLMMLFIAWKLPETRPHGVHTGPLPRPRDLVEWKVLTLSIALFMYAVGHGGATAFSAVLAHAHGIEPRGLFFTVNAVMILITRPLSGPLADRIGPHKIMIPSLALIFIGLLLLAFSTTKPLFITAAVVYGLGIGNVYPVFSAYIIQRVPSNRRGAAFGSILAAFDTGVGTGSIVTGLLIGQFGFQTAFLVSAALSGCAIPYFLIVEKRLNFNVIVEGERTEG